jgi:hypothetical protein
METETNNLMVTMLTSQDALCKEFYQFNVRVYGGDQVPINLYLMSIIGKKLSSLDS